jgi:hypothetical protein
VITGNVGVSPGTVVTGFPLGIVLLGAIHVDDALADSAHTDAISAYTALVAEACDFDLTGTNLGGLLLTPGKYCFTGDATLTGILTLNTLSNPESVFIFQIGNDFSTSAVSSVVTLLNVLDCNVYFVVAGTTTMNTGTVFLGNVIGQGNINLDALVTVAGRVITTGGSITLDDNVVTNATCATCVDGLSSSQMPGADSVMRWLLSLIWGVPKHPRHASKAVLVDSAASSLTFSEVFVAFALIVSLLLTHLFA